MGEKILTFLGRSETWIVGAALVVFLVVTWVLRGASVLQAAAEEEDADAPAPAIATGSWPAWWSG